MSRSRRNYLRSIGHVLGGGLLTAATARIFSPPAEDAEFIPQSRRFAWQIDPEKCRYCGVCESACVRRPSAVKALNDQKQCSNCVVCYGHITNLLIDSDKIDSEGRRVCVHDAVLRKNFCGGLDGMFLYSHDHVRCTACGECVKRCNEHGTKSMFLAIRPDLCLGCNECTIAAACPHQAVERVPLEVADDLRGVPEMDEFYWEEQG